MLKRVLFVCTKNDLPKLYTINFCVPCVFIVFFFFFHKTIFDQSTQFYSSGIYIFGILTYIIYIDVLWLQHHVLQKIFSMMSEINGKHSPLEWTYFRLIQQIVHKQTAHTFLSNNINCFKHNWYKLLPFQQTKKIIIGFCRNDSFLFHCVL